MTFQDAKGTALTWMNPGGPADAGATIKVYGNTAATTAGATPHNAGNSDVEKGEIIYLTNINLIKLFNKNTLNCLVY